MENFEDVFNQYGSLVYRFLLKLSGDEYLSDELTQETFFKAFIHIGSFRGTSSMYTWLCQISKNLYINELRRKKRFADYSPDLTAESTQNIERQTLKREQISEVLAIVATLPDLSREVFSLRVFGELKYKEIGAQLGKSETWAKVTFFRAKEQIIKNMEELEWI